MGRKPVKVQFKRSRQMTLMLTNSEYERVELLTELGGFANTSDAVRAAIEEALLRLQSHQPPTSG
jgi:Arc/MetJ-type ribon-helix-helix transcriptional regulator